MAKAPPEANRDRFPPTRKGQWGDCGKVVGTGDDVKNSGEQASENNGGHARPPERANARFKFIGTNDREIERPCKALHRQFARILASGQSVFALPGFPFRLTHC